MPNQIQLFFIRSMYDAIHIYPTESDCHPSLRSLGQGSYMVKLKAECLYTKFLGLSKLELMSHGFGFIWRAI